MNRPRPRPKMGSFGYRQLQAFAKAMKLPGNMKYQVLWDMVQARQLGNERRVNQILAEQKRIRLEKRIKRKVARIQEETTRKGQAALPVPDEPCNSQGRPNHSNQRTTPEKRAVAIVSPRVRGLPHPQQWLENHGTVVHLIESAVRIVLMRSDQPRFAREVQQCPLLEPSPGQFEPYRYGPRPSTQNRLTNGSAPSVRMAVRRDDIIHDSAISDDDRIWGARNSYQQADDQLLQPSAMNFPMPSNSIQVTSTNYIHYSREVCISSVIVPSDVQIIGQQYQEFAGTEEQTTYYVDSTVTDNTSDTQSANEVVDEEDFSEMDLYSGFEPYIEEVICSNYEDEPQESEISENAFACLEPDQHGGPVDSKVGVDAPLLAPTTAISECATEAKPLTVFDSSIDPLMEMPKASLLGGSAVEKREDDVCSIEGDLEIVIPEEIDPPLDHGPTNDLLKVVSP